MNKAKLIIVQLSTEHRSHIATLALEIEPGCEAACRECRGRLGRLGMVDIKHDLSTDHCEPSLKRYHPSPRRYHCAEQVEGQLYVWGGLTVTPISLKTVDVFDPHLEKWTQCFTTGSQPKGFSNGASASVDVHRCMYVYGGSDGKGSSYYGALHQLDVVDFIWTQLSPHCHNGPMRKVACGMVSYKRDLIVFGGYGSHSPFSRAPFDTQVGPTNELHVFNLDIGKWFCPAVTGTMPPPCRNFSLSMISSHQAVLFGGYAEAGATNDTYILDLDVLAWSKLVTKEGAPCPVGRLTHGSVCLGYGSDHPQLLVVGGVGVDEAQGMCYEDATSIWILDLRSESWREVAGEKLLRSGHSVVCLESMSGCSEVIVFGGVNSIDASENTVMLVVGVQSLQELCTSVIKSALLEQKIHSLQAGLPAYVPTAIKHRIIHLLDTHAQSSLVGKVFIR